MFTCMQPPPMPPSACRKQEGSPSILPSQSITIVSSSVHAGLEAWCVGRVEERKREEGGGERERERERIR